MNIEEILENSYKNFHAKGLHYICLQRSPLVTVKAYFFEGDVVNAAEVVVPHNHRYDFVTEVLAGELLDKEYREVVKNPGLATRLVQRWDYMTPLNGGKGFKWASEAHLWWFKEHVRSKGETLFSTHDKIHTISVKPDTVLLLTQLHDKLALDKPTQAYSFGSKEQKPSTSGLYDKFKADEVLKYIEQLKQLGVDMESCQNT